MGCDIHLYIETRKDKTEPWSIDDFHTYDRVLYDADASDSESYLEINKFGNRNYYMFGLMAAVRGINAIFQPKDLPGDVSQILAEKSACTDYHSHSWLSLDEFKICLNQREKDYKNENGPEKTWSDSYDECYKKASEWLLRETGEAHLLGNGAEPQIRFIFWFDN